MVLVHADCSLILQNNHQYAALHSDHQEFLPAEFISLSWLVTWTGSFLGLTES